MVDPISVTLTLLDALTSAVAGAKGNKGQCEALGTRAQRIADELGRLPAATRLDLARRGVFAGEHHNYTFQRLIKGVAAAKWCPVNMTIPTDC